MLASGRRRAAVVRPPRRQGQGHAGEDGAPPPGDRDGHGVHQHPPLIAAVPLPAAVLLPERPQAGGVADGAERDAVFLFVDVLYASAVADVADAARDVVDDVALVRDASGYAVVSCDGVAVGRISGCAAAADGDHDGLRRRPRRTTAKHHRLTTKT